MEILETIRLPFYQMLEHRGHALDAVEAAEGLRSMAHAMRRCALCDLNEDCCAALDAHGADLPAACPNAGLFYRAGARA